VGSSKHHVEREEVVSFIFMLRFYLKFNVYAISAIQNKGLQPLVLQAASAKSLKVLHILYRAQSIICLIFPDPFLRLRTNPNP